MPSAYGLVIPPLVGSDIMSGPYNRPPPIYRSSLHLETSYSLPPYSMSRSSGCGIAPSGYSRYRGCGSSSRRPGFGGGYPMDYDAGYGQMRGGGFRGVIDPIGGTLNGLPFRGGYSPMPPLPGCEGMVERRPEPRGHRGESGCGRHGSVGHGPGRGYGCMPCSRSSSRSRGPSPSSCYDGYDDREFSMSSGRTTDYMFTSRSSSMHRSRMSHSSRRRTRDRSGEGNGGGNHVSFSPPYMRTYPTTMAPPPGLPANPPPYAHHSPGRSRNQGRRWDDSSSDDWEDILDGYDDVSSLAHMSFDDQRKGRARGGRRRDGNGGRSPRYERSREDSSKRWR